MFEDHDHHNCTVELEDGSTYLLGANWIHNQNLDSWKGWYCAAGMQRLMIDENFGVWSGECMNDFLGDLSHDWMPFEQPTICGRDRCTGCTDDLLVRKQKEPFST